MASKYGRAKRSLLSLSLLSIAALLVAGCTQDDGNAGVDIAGGQDTAGQISDTTPAADLVVTTDAAMAIDISSSIDAGLDAQVATDTQVAPDTTVAVDTATPPDAGSKPDVTDGKLRWFMTCGDPACSGWKAKSGVPLCSTEKAKDPCSSPGDKCDPKNGCNAILVCADKDPKSGPGGCPISARRFKKGIRYLDQAAEAGLRDELLQLPLATWQYRNSVRTRRTLGYILEDAPRMPATDMGRERVDVYALSTMTVAAIKAQQRELRELRAEMAALRAACGAKK